MCALINVFQWLEKDKLGLKMESLPCRMIIAMVFISIFSCCESVKIEFVGLSDNLTYARYAFPAHFAYRLKLEPNEAVKQVVWTSSHGNGSYEWTEDSVRATGIFSDATEAPKAEKVNDGDFIFSRVRLSLAGNYTLAVTTNMGNDSAVFNFIVLDYKTGTVGFPSLSNQKINCKWNVSVFREQMVPYPNISCQFEDGTYGETVPVSSIAHTNVEITDLYNGAYDYHLGVSVPIVEVPLEAYFVCDHWIGDSKINLVKMKTSSVSGKPCSEPLERQNFTSKMLSGDESCRGGYVPLTVFGFFCSDDPSETIVKKLKCISGKAVWKEEDNEKWPSCVKKVPKKSSFYSSTATSLYSRRNGATIGLWILGLTYLHLQFYIFNI